MLRGSLSKKIFLFAMPIALGSMLQQLFNSVDEAVVGRFVGSQALAAVGSNVQVIGLFINLFVGISVGANVVIATYVGEREQGKISFAVHTSILVALISGIFLLVLIQFIAKPLLLLMSSPGDVIDLAVLYLKIYALGMPFNMLYNFGAAILRSAGDSKRPLYCLILSGLTNAGLNVVFVAVFHMGVAGVAIATDISQALSAFMVIRFLMKEESAIRLEWKSIRLHREQLVNMLKLGIPSGIQGVLFSISNVCIQTSVNGFGSSAIAGSSVTMTFEFFCFFAVSGFVQAAITFVSQNRGARQWDRCRKIFWLALGEGVAVTVVLSAVFYLNRGFFVGLFTTDEEAVFYAIRRMKDVILFYCIMCTYEITGGVMRGHGHSMMPTIITVFGTCIFRIVWTWTIAAGNNNFDRLMYVYPVSWVLTGSMMLAAYFILRLIPARQTVG